MDESPQIPNNLLFCKHISLPGSGLSCCCFTSRRPRRRHLLHRPRRCRLRWSPNWKAMKRMCCSPRTPSSRCCYLAQSYSYNKVLGPKTRLAEARLVYQSPTGFKVWTGPPDRMAWLADTLLVRFSFIAVRAAGPTPDRDTGTRIRAAAVWPAAHGRPRAIAIGPSRRT